MVTTQRRQPQTSRLSYIGQDPFVSGEQDRQQIVALLSLRRPCRRVNSDPWLSNNQPRLNGAIQATLRGNAEHPVRIVAASAPQASPADRVGFLGVQSPVSSARHSRASSRSTAAVSRPVALSGQEELGLKASSWVGGELSTWYPLTEQLLAASYIDFTIDQQPYLQGFCPILGCFFWHSRTGLTRAY